MSTDNSMDDLLKRRKRLNGMVSAKTVEALTPFLKQIGRLSEGLYSWMTYGNKRWGMYMVPVENGSGVYAYVVDAYRILRIWDKEGFASEPMRVHLPKGLLKACKTKTTKLVDENNESFTVEAEPKPSTVCITDMFGLVCLEHKEDWQKEKYNGTLGAWHDPRLIQKADIYDSYHCEAADVTFLQKIKISADFDSKEPVIDPFIVKPILQAADVLDENVTIEMAGKSNPIIVRSFGNEIIWSALMPLDLDRKATEIEIHSVDVLAGIKAAETVTEEP